MDGAQVGVLEKSNQVSLRCFLESHDSAALETQVSLEILSDLTDQTLEGQLADQEFCRFLVTTNLTKSHGTRTVAMRFFHATGGRSGLPGGLGGQLLTRGLASGRFTSGLLGSCHYFHGSINLVSKASRPPQKS